MEAKLSCTTEEAIAGFAYLTERYAALFKQHTREQLLWQPGSGIWCVAECVEHVALTNSAYLKNILPVVERGRVSAAGNESLHVGGWLSGLLLKNVSPQAPRKLKAPKKIRPLAVQPGKAFEQLQETHAKILALLELRPHPDFNRIRFPNPFFPLIKFTVASGILIMVAHGRRHLLQAERVCSMPGFRAAAA
jgi:hypothetical protein